MKSLLVVALVFLISRFNLVFCQDLEPTLFVKENNKNTNLEISQIAIQVKVNGLVSQTDMTLTFFNPFNRPLTGDFYFPLPEGAVISSYALDINGVLIDSVAVGKEKARVVYEKIVRQNVDPGLVEWTQGNNFKTRVFPIPAQGSRTIKVSYVSPLLEKNGEPVYKLPLHFSSKIKEGAIRIEVIESIIKPNVMSSPSEIEFEQWQKGFLAEKKLKNEELNKELIFTLPKVSNQSMVIEKSKNDQYFFVLHDMPQLPKSVEVLAPQRIDIIWDASTSRETINHTIEFEFLKEYFANQKNSKIAVNLFLLRNVLQKEKDFIIEAGDCSNLIAHLKKVIYDGGTNLENLFMSSATEKPDLCFLFSDGIGNVGQINTLEMAPAPVYCFSASSSINSYFLRKVSMQTSGQYINLLNKDLKTVAKQIGQLNYTLIGIQMLSGEADVIRNSEEVCSGRFDILGVLKSNTCQIEVQYGFVNKITKRVKYQLNKDLANNGDIIRKYWAQEKLKDLLLSPEENEKLIYELGVTHQIVTPETSLIVLENVASYIEHKIEPPLSMPEWRKQYFQMISEIVENQKQAEANHLRYVENLWQTRLNWWNTDFAKHNKLRSKEKKSYEEDKDKEFDRNEESSMSKKNESKLDNKLRATVESKTKVLGFDSKIKSEKLDSELETNTESFKKIELKQWTSNAVYLKALQEAKDNTFFDKYLELKKEYRLSPGFYFDCAGFFKEKKLNLLALQILSNIAELNLEEPSQLRVLAYKLMEFNEFDDAVAIFRRILKLRGEEPQSYRDLALALLNRANYNFDVKGVTRKLLMADLEEGLKIQAKVVLTKWDRFQEIELIALGELNKYLTQAKSLGFSKSILPDSLEKLLDLDIRIVLSWDADMVDMDLWVIEPSGEQADYSHPNSTIGGHVSRDFTQGYGPEEYILKKGMPGNYKIKVNYFGSSSRSLLGPVTLKVDVYINYGRPNEQHKVMNVRLKDSREVVEVGDIVL